MAPDFKVIREPFDDVLRARRSSIYTLPSVEKLIINTVHPIRGCWIAGGAALALYTGNDLKIKDWDVFCESRSKWQEVRSIFENKGFVKTSESEWSVTFSLGGVDLQLITRHWYPEVGDIFKKFDFTVCCFAIDGDDFVYIMEAKKDALAKEFNFIYTENLPTCMKRIARYGAKGYFPSARFALDIAKAFKKTKLDTIRKSKARKDS